MQIINEIIIPMLSNLKTWQNLFGVVIGGVIGIGGALIGRWYDYKKQANSTYRAMITEIVTYWSLYSRTFGEYLEESKNEMLEINFLPINLRPIIYEKNANLIGLIPCRGLIVSIYTKWEIMLVLFNTNNKILNELMVAKKDSSQSKLLELEKGLKYIFPQLKQWHSEIGADINKLNSESKKLPLMFKYASFFFAFLLVVELLNFLD